MPSVMRQRGSCLWWGAVIAGVIISKSHGFVVPKSIGSERPSGLTRHFMSDIPREPRPTDEEENWLLELLPPKPEDQLTMGGDIFVLFLYVFTNHVLNDVYLSSIFFSHSTALEAAKAIDPIGADIVVSSAPVWLDTGVPEVVDHVLMQNLQQQIIPHLSPILSTPGTSSAALISCWLVTCYFHRAYLFKNTLSCSTERVIGVTFKAFLTSTFLMTVLACASWHLFSDVSVASQWTAQATTSGDPLNALLQWFAPLTRADADYICDSFTVLIIWRFLVSQILGGWSK